MANGVIQASDLYPSAGFFPGSTQPTSERANGAVESGRVATAPAFAWLGMVVLLIALRVVWELSERSA